MKSSKGAEQPETFGSGTLLSHLLELRRRLLFAIIAVGVVFAALAPFADKLFTWIAVPLIERLPVGSHMIATQVASPFLAPFKLALVTAVFIAIPILLYQIWAFVAPGLYRSERRMIMPLLSASTILFYTGMVFAYFVVFPMMFGFFAHTAPEGVAVMTDINNYLDFVLALFFAFGFAFEIPVATVLLVWVGLVNIAWLKKNRPYVLLGVFIVGMLLTPPDVISQTLLAVPMYILYELGIVFAKVMVPAKDEASDET
ncbi:MAG TPA: twin-arginine translocase subunit TatC [Gammaproteobacteria bacterium]|nr:twin-arginine translocase subunit TatC [Gammaproteobacteria bacterium]